MKKLLVVICLSLLFSGISVLFWYSEWKFRLPVPVASGPHAPMAYGCLLPEHTSK